MHPRLNGSAAWDVSRSTRLANRPQPIASPQIWPRNPKRLDNNGRDRLKSLISREWRGGRAVECTGLENRRPFTGIVGSNPTLSAIMSFAGSTKIAERFLDVAVLLQRSGAKRRTSDRPRSRAISPSPPVVRSILIGQVSPPLQRRSGDIARRATPQGRGAKRRVVPPSPPTVTGSCTRGRSQLRLRQPSFWTRTDAISSRQYLLSGPSEYYRNLRRRFPANHLRS